MTTALERRAAKCTAMQRLARENAALQAEVRRMRAALVEYAEAIDEVSGARADMARGGSYLRFDVACRAMDRAELTAVSLGRELAKREGGV